MYRRIHKSFGISDTRIITFVKDMLAYIERPGDVSVHCIGDTRMTRLNEQYRGKKQTTDVLSFPTETEEWFGMNSEQDWGDIFLSIPQIRRQAKRFHVSFQEEFFRILAHGVLHLLGYNHDTKARAIEMFSLQEYLVFGKEVEILPLLESRNLFCIEAH